MILLKDMSTLHNADYHVLKLEFKIYIVESFVKQPDSAFIVIIRTIFILFILCTDINE